MSRTQASWLCPSKPRSLEIQQPAVTPLGVLALSLLATVSRCCLEFCPSPSHLSLSRHLSPHYRCCYSALSLPITSDFNPPLPVICQKCHFCKTDFRLWPLVCSTGFVFCCVLGIHSSDTGFRPYMHGCNRIRLHLEHFNQGCQTYGMRAKTGPLGCSVRPAWSILKIRKIQILFHSIWMNNKI